MLSTKKIMQVAAVFVSAFAPLDALRVTRADAHTVRTLLQPRNTSNFVKPRLDENFFYNQQQDFAAQEKERQALQRAAQQREKQRQEAQQRQMQHQKEMHEKMEKEYLKYNQNLKTATDLFHYE